jgi:hypothetical protein
MLSALRKGLVYNNISTDIVEHDLDVDADQWSYDDKDVYRGSVDPDYLAKDLNVYWLYDDNLKRVGLAEHEANEPEVFKALWFYDNPFATLYQDPNWKSTGSTLWSKLSNEAYQDYLEGTKIQNEALKSGLLLVTPKMLIEPPKIYICEKCGEKSLVPVDVCPQASAFDLDFSQFSILFLDDDFVIYEHSVPAVGSASDPLGSTTPQCDASLPELPEQTESADQESSEALQSLLAASEQSLPQQQ